MTEALGLLNYPPGSAARRKWGACTISKGRLHAQYSDETCPRQALCMVPSALPLGEGLVISSAVELGAEILVHIPWAYALSVRGSLSLSYSLADSAPFYFFSPKHCEAAPTTQTTQRESLNLANLIPSYAGAQQQVTSPWPLGPGPALISTAARPETIPAFERGADWLMPPFYAHYCGSSPFWFAGLPYIVILSKKNKLRTGTNSLSNEALISLYDALSPHYLVVYHRATPGLHDSERHNFVEDTSDFDALRAHAFSRQEEKKNTSSRRGGQGAQQQQQQQQEEAYSLRSPRIGRAAADGEEVEGRTERVGNLVLLPELLLEARDAALAQGGEPISINDLLLSTLADADGFISVAGGPSYLGLLWGPHVTNVIYQREGPEYDTHAETWFGLLSGTRVMTTADDMALADLALEAFVAPLAESLRVNLTDLSPTLERENVMILSKAKRRRAGNGAAP